MTTNRLPATVDQMRGLRAARWIRESSGRQLDKYGPSAQKAMQDRALAGFGMIDTGLAWTVAKSGWSGPDSMEEPAAVKTPEFQSMLAAAGRGEFDVLLVGYTSRFIRDLALALHYRRVFHRMGVVIYICDDGLLSSNATDWERFADKAKAAEVYSRDLSKNIRSGYATKRQRDRDPGGRPPLGFRRNDAKFMEPDESRLSVVRRAFDLSASGATDVEVSMETGVPLFTVRGMLSSPLYVGLLRDGGPANWLPLADLTIWNRVQEQRARRATNSGRPAYASRPYSLTMLSCRACGRRLTGDTGYYRHRDPCPEFLAAKPVLPPTRGRHASGRGYPMNWYEDAVGDLLKHVSLGADVIARVVEEIQGDVAPEPLQNARVKRERAAATQRLERDRDTDAWQATMRKLDAEEAAAKDTRPEVIPAAQVVAYLKSLPETWRRAAGGRGRRMLAETLFSGIRVSGFREIEFKLTPHGAALGLAEALPAAGLELRVSGYGRGERSQPSGTDPNVPVSWPLPVRVIC